MPSASNKTPTPSRITEITVSKKPWDKACNFNLHRLPPVETRKKPGARELLEPGVNFFILTLEKLGVETLYSCEGHPEGFYILFQTNLETVDRIERCGYFQIRRFNKKWHLGLCLQRTKDQIIKRKPEISKEELRQRLELEKKKILRLAALAWQKEFLQRPPDKEGAFGLMMRGTH